MKKCLSSFAAGLFLLFSAGVSAVPITAGNWTGSYGEVVSVMVSLTSPATDSFGWDFLIDYEPDKLRLKGIANDADPSEAENIGNDEYFPHYQLQHSPRKGSNDQVIPGQEKISLTNNEGLGASGPKGLFTLLFDILVNGSYVTIVDIDDYNLETDQINGSDPLASATVTVNAGNNGTIPEPGALVLVALGLLIMTGVGRRSRLFR